MKNNQKIFLLFLPLILLAPNPVFADDDGEDAIKNLGWIAIACGVIANLPFVVISRYRRYAVRAGGQSMEMARKIGTVFKPILNFHIMLNSIGYAAGMIHGYLFSEHLDSISLSLAITMTVLMTSGVMLRYTSSRNTKVFNRLLHGQFVIVFLLIALVVLHLITAED